MALLGVPPCEPDADSAFFREAETLKSWAADEMPEMVHEGRPDYPESVKRAGVTGTVWIKALVDTAGVVRCVKVQKTSGIEALDVASAKAAYLCKYKPAVREGKPVACWVSYPCRFTLGK